MEEQAIVTSDAQIERKLQSSGQLAVKGARIVVINNQQDYEDASKYLIEIKTMTKAVKDYWAQPKAAAKAAHQTIVDREKEMLVPLIDAEAIVKRTMVTYQAAVEKARREAEEEARKRQQEEAERLLQQAINSAESGDDHAAAVNMAMAEMVDEMRPQVAIEQPVAAGTSVRKTWKARVICDQQVPAYASGMEIRKIDMSALNNIAKMTKGTAHIPGVEFYLDSSLAVRT